MTSGSAPPIVSVVSTALIVAPDAAGLAHVFGVPAVRRLALLSRRLGLGAIHVMAASGRVLGAVADLVPASGLHLVLSPPALCGVLDGLDVRADDRILVMPADQVVDERSLTHLLGAPARGEVLWLSGTGKGGENGRREGIFLVETGRLEPLLEALWFVRSPDFPGMSKIQAHSRLPMQIDCGAGTARSAEKEIMNNLTLSTSNTDSFLARHVDRPVSRFFSPRIARRGIGPNVVTASHIVLGLCGALLIGLGHYWSQVIGSLLFVTCIIVDGVDGEVARLQIKESRFGHYLDIVGDNVVHVAVFAGIAVGLYRGTSDGAYLTALWFLLGGFGLCAIAVDRTIGHGPDKTRSSHPPWLMRLLANRDFAYLVLIAAVFGRLEWFLFATAVGVYLFSLGLFALLIVRRLRPTAEDVSSVASPARSDSVR